jgi:UDP-glucuronate 4-epimerase
MRYKTVLVTGCAGFIGFHLCKRLLSDNFNVVGIDNMNDYYDVSLKQDRLNILLEKSHFKFIGINLQDRTTMEWLFKTYEFDIVVNLAAQAGVRYSIENPYAYVDSNVVGFLNILEGCRYHKVEHLVFASSSSVYGANVQIPFSTSDGVDHPKAIYAATKKANEMMAHSYSSLYNLPCTGIRFFTVYGPYGRPDLSLFLFTKAIFEDKPIQVFNHGDMSRDFTYVDDVVEGVKRIMLKPPEPDCFWQCNPSRSYAPYRIYNIGNNNPIDLNKFIEIIEDTIGKKAKKEYVGMQDGDVKETYADIGDLIRDFNFKPSTPIEAGIKKFVDWYKNYYEIGE